MALLPSIQPAAVPVQINFKFFFDRAGVAAHISKKKKMGLWRAGSVVMQIARRSIKKMGMAKPTLKVQKTYSSLTLGQISQLPGATTERLGVMRDDRGRFLKGSGGLSSRDGLLTESDRKKVLQRIKEIKRRDASRAGTPPHTHGGQLRNSIVYAYDPSSESVVVGGFMRGIPRIVSLHEFGGTQRMQAWAWIPQEGNTRRVTGIIGWWAVGREPYRNPGNWQPMGPKWQENFQYPARPYMQPALMRGILSGRIPRGFGSGVNMSGMPGT